MATTLPMKTPLILLRHFYFLNHTRALFPHPFSFHKSVNPNSWPGLEKNKVPWITWNCWFWKFLNYKTSNFLWSNLIVFYWKTVNPVVMFSSVAQSCLTVCDPMDCSTPGLPVHHQIPELAQTQVRWVSDAIQPSHPLSSPSLPAFSLSQHQGLFQWVSSSHQEAKSIEVSALASVLPMNTPGLLQDWLVWSPCKPRDS